MAMFVVTVVFVAVAVLAARFGADTRYGDPRMVEPQWPFFRHRS